MHFLNKRNPVDNFKDHSYVIIMTFPKDDDDEDKKMMLNQKREKNIYTVSLLKSYLLMKMMKLLADRKYFFHNINNSLIFLSRTFTCENLMSKFLVR